jgi:hypothetical protein
MSCGLKTNLLPFSRPELCKVLLARSLIQRTQSVLFGVLLALTVRTAMARQRTFPRLARSNENWLR